MKTGLKLGGVFTFTHRDQEGNVKNETFSNLITTEGINHILDVFFPTGGDTAPTNLYVGLVDGTPTVDGSDTMSSHAGWSEVVAYSEATRPAFTDVRTNQTVSNVAAKATFTINANSTVVGGAFITTDSTKSGTNGVLFSVGASDSGDRTFQQNDTLEVRYDFTAANV